MLTALRNIFQFKNLTYLVLVIEAFVMTAMIGGFITLGQEAHQSISALPAEGTLYGTIDVAWVGWGRNVGHGISMVMNLLIGVLLIGYGIKREKIAIKFITSAIGVQLILSAMLNATMIGLINVGGWWHVAALVVAMLMGLSAVASALVFALTGSTMMTDAQMYNEVDQLGESQERT